MSLRTKHSLVDRMRHEISLHKSAVILAILGLSLASYDAYAKPNIPSPSLELNDRPAILRGLPAQDPKSDAAFKARVTASFTLPLKENQVTQNLTRQGFKLKPNEGAAYYSESYFPCFYLWNISWDSDSEHNITRIKGRHTASCG